MSFPASYTLLLCGLTRELPVIELNEALAIASFVMPGDTELIERAAEALVGKGDFRMAGIDFLVCPEAKALPLTHAMARILGLDYVVVRKSEKAYMRNVLRVSSSAITTAGEQQLVLDGRDADRLRGTRIVIVDDVVSTGGSLRALENLIEPLDCCVAAKAAVLLEEAGYEGDDLVYLERLPIFTNLQK